MIKLNANFFYFCTNNRQNYDEIYLIELSFLHGLFIIDTLVFAD